MLVHRRRSNSFSLFAKLRVPVISSILLMLYLQLTLGLCTIAVSAQHLDGTEMVKFMEWAQGIVMLHPAVAILILHVNPIFKLHLFLGMTIFLVFPFTRLVDVWSAPVWYLGRTGFQVVRTKQPLTNRARDQSLTVADLVTKLGPAKPIGSTARQPIAAGIGHGNAHINDVTIPNGTIAREAQNHAVETPKAAWELATRALVIRELLLQRARALELVAEPRVQDRARETDEEAFIRLVLEREVCTPTADEAICRRYYDRHPDRFRSLDSFEPAHILFKALRDDVVAYAKAVAQAEAVLAQLKERPDSFDSLRAASPIALRRRRAGGLDRSYAVIQRPNSKPSWSQCSLGRSVLRRCGRATVSTCFDWIARLKARRCHSWPSKSGLQPIWKSERGAARSRSI